MVPFDGIASVTVEVACTGAVHRARFVDGELTLADHDVDAERAMAALGGDVPACMLLRDMWIAATANVAAGEAGSIHGLLRLGDAVRDEPPWEPPRLPFAGPTRPGVVRSLMHTRLPGGLEDVLAQAAVLQCELHWDDPSLPDAGRRAGHRLLSSRLQEALTETLSLVRDHRHPVRVTLACRVANEGNGTIDVTAGRGHVRIEVTLRLGWLVRVWRAGLATAAGLLVLDVVEGGPGDDRIAVRALQWDRSGSGLQPRLIRAHIERTGRADRDGGWDGGWAVAGADPAGSSGEGQWWSIRTAR